MEIFSNEGPVGLPQKLTHSMSMSGLETSRKASRGILSETRSRTSTVCSQTLDRILNNEDNDARVTHNNINDVLTNKIGAGTLDNVGTKKNRSSSSPDIHSVDKSRKRTKQRTDSSGGKKKSSKSEPKKMAHYRSMSDYGLPHKQIFVGVDPEGTSDVGSPESGSLSSSLPTKIQKPGYHDTVDGSTGGPGDSYFPRPTKGQSLRSFLSSQDFHTCAELDKENAHFSISEALIAAIEQMKWNQIIRPQRESDHEEGDSDEEIQELKQRIRIRRRERLQEKARGFPAFSDGKTDNSSSSDSCEEIDKEIAEVDAADTTASNLTTLSKSGLSLSMASLYSDADLQKQPIVERSLERTVGSGGVDTSLQMSYMSAESVAISLLMKFSEKELPKASDLEWLVSEQDAPQALLPLPNSYPVSPDEGENADLTRLRKSTRIRGNLEWAPPRAQIIFNIHPPPRRKEVIAKQNYRCAGCGTKVEPAYMKRFRYCEYLGKYFCPCCHTNASSYIPGRILRKWDFNKYMVSNFARDLLNRMYNDPLFNISDINPGLYRKVRILDQVRECRLQLYHLQMFIKTCRLDQKLWQQLESQPGHWTSDVHAYSLQELVQVKKLELLPQLKNLVNDCVAHVTKCPLCQVKGFICELCNNEKEIIFPFELTRVTQCPACSACYHKACYIPDRCPKCARIELRKNRLSQSALQEQSSDSEEANDR